MPLKTIPYDFLKLSAKLVSILFFCTFITSPNYLEALQNLGGNYPSRKIDKIEIAEERILKEYAQFDFIDIIIYKVEISKGTLIKPSYFSSNSDKGFNMICENNSWLFVVDFYPGAYFAHRIDIGVLDTVSEKFKLIESAEWWPLIDGKSYFFDSMRWKKVRRSEKTTSFKKGNFRSQIYCGCTFKNKEVPPRLVTQDNIVFKNTACFNKIWAIIICGYYEEPDKASLSYDTDDMYSLLRAYQIPPDKIFYITPNASEHNKIFSANVSCYTIQEAFDSISKSIVKNEKFLFFISTHGGQDNLLLSNDGKKDESINAYQINEWLNAIQCKTIFIIINSCYSGSFIGYSYDKYNRCCNYDKAKDDLIFNNPRNRIVIATACDNEYSYGDKDINADNDCDGNYYDRGSEFVSGFIEAFTNTGADNNTINEKISFSEAFSYAKKCCLICSNKCFKMCQFETYIPCINPVLIPNHLADNEFLFWD